MSRQSTYGKSNINLNSLWQDSIKIMRDTYYSDWSTH